MPSIRELVDVAQPVLNVASAAAASLHPRLPFASGGLGVLEPDTCHVQCASGFTFTFPARVNVRGMFPFVFSRSLVLYSNGFYGALPETFSALTNLLYV